MDRNVRIGDTIEYTKGMSTPRLTYLSLGWGVQSFTMAAMIALGDLPPVDFAIHADTGHEAAGTYAHAKAWTPWLAQHGVQVVTVKGSRTDVVREDWGSVMIPAFTTDCKTGSRGQVRRQCTHDWKIMPIRRFLRSIMGSRPAPGAVECWQGITIDEFQRMRTSDVKYTTNAYPLVDRRISRADCIGWLVAHGLTVPPKSACTFCPFHSLDAWRRMKRAGGSDWKRAVFVDQAIREERPKHELFVHPARKPLPLAVSIPEDHGGAQAEMDLETPCDGGVCFT